MSFNSQNIRAQAIIKIMEDYSSFVGKSPGIPFSFPANKNNKDPIKNKRASDKTWFRIIKHYPIFKRYEDKFPPAIHTLYQLTFIPIESLCTFFDKDAITRDTSLEEAKDLVSIFVGKSRKMGRPSPLREKLNKLEKIIESLQCGLTVSQEKNKELQEKYDILYHTYEELLND